MPSNLLLFLFVRLIFLNKIKRTILFIINLLYHQSMLQYLKPPSDSMLPPINLNSFSIILLSIVVFKYLINHITRRFMRIREHNLPKQPLDMMYFYHLAIIVLVIPQINWNLFDISIWIFSYIIVGIIRHLLNDIQTQRHLLLNGLVYDSNIINLLTMSQRLNFIILILTLAYIIVSNWYFWHATVKVNQILLYPTFMLALDSIYTLSSSRIIRKKISYFFNNNIDLISPLFKLESFYVGLKSVLGLWHFSYFIRIIYKTSNSLTQILFSPWIIDILKAFYDSCRSFGNCVIQYQNSDGLLKRINTFLVKGSPEPNQNCAICQQLLLSCRQIKQCRHKFHFKCILMWLKSKEHPECPICRSVIIRSRHIYRQYQREAE